MRIAITGAEGFIGSNLKFRLREAGYSDFIKINHGLSTSELTLLLEGVDFVFHLAGVNRPKNTLDFKSGNVFFTKKLVDVITRLSISPRLVFTSSTQAGLDNPYGRSKLAAEEILKKYSEKTKTPVYLFRLTNVFGKWCRPNYNSVVATFCHNISRNITNTINDSDAILKLIYIDDLIDIFLDFLKKPTKKGGYVESGPIYNTTVGKLDEILNNFYSSRKDLIIPGVGSGLIRALYATYISYLPIGSTSYEVPLHQDKRGVFVEMLKTPDHGQFSYFTANPGETRGEHYHHTKTEKFFVIKGKALFSFREINSGETHEMMINGNEGKVVQSIPGWVHNITNNGNDELVVMLWSNEIFNDSCPDTIPMKVKV